MSGMDIDALHSTLLSISLVSDKIRVARENLPVNGRSAVHLGNLLDKAEDDLRVAKATLAHELGFRLCPRCWPPELIATDRSGRAPGRPRLQIPYGRPPELRFARIPRSARKQRCRGGRVGRSASRQ